MLAYLLEFLRDQPVLVFFLVLSLGYLVGNIRVAGISLGSVGGVLLLGLLFGHLGFTMHAGGADLRLRDFHLLRRLPGRPAVLRRAAERRPQVPFAGAGRGRHRVRARGRAGRMDGARTRCWPPACSAVP